VDAAAWAQRPCCGLWGPQTGAAVVAVVAGYQQAVRDVPPAGAASPPWAVGGAGRRGAVVLLPARSAAGAGCGQPAAAAVGLSSAVGEEWLEVLLALQLAVVATAMGLQLAEVVTATTRGPGRWAVIDDQEARAPGVGCHSAGRRCWVTRMLGVGCWGQELVREVE